MPVKMIPIVSKQGDNFDFYLTFKHSMVGPGVIILGDQFGLQPWLKMVADEFAERGYLVSVPNFNWQRHSLFETDLEGEPKLPKPADTRLKTSQELQNYDKYIGIIDSVLNKSRSHPACNGKIAIVGFSLGGTYSFLAAARLDPDVAIAFYPIDIENHLTKGKFIDCPTIIHVGRKDVYMKEKNIKKIHAALIGKFNIAIYQYEAGHGFSNSQDLPNFQPEAKNLSFERTFNLLDSLK